MKKTIRWVVSLTISGAGLWFVLRGTDLYALKNSLLNIRSPGWLFLYPAVILFEFFMRSIRWKILFQSLKNLSVTSIFPITAAGFLVNNVLPFRAGDMARAYWTSQLAVIPLSSSITILIADRVFDMASLLSLVFLVLFKKSHLFSSPHPVIFFSLITLGVFIFLLAMARYPQHFKKMSHITWMPQKISLWITQFIEGAQSLQSARALIGTYGISVFFWIINVTLLQYVAGLFSISLTWIDAAWVMIGICLGAMLPSAPGFVGTIEAAGVAALHLLGHPKEQALSFILLIHFAMISSTLVWGIPCLFKTGLSGLRSESHKKIPKNT